MLKSVKNEQMKKNILIIDNSEIIRNLLTDYLDDLGYGIEMAVNGQEGIEMALSRDYDLVFCDIHMPKKNGYQVYCEVTEKKPQLPFIMTDSLPDDLADKAVDKGAFACLAKPFSLDQIEEVLRDIFKRD